MTFKLGKNTSSWLVRAAAWVVPVGLLTLTGCHSAFIETTLTNRTESTLRLVEVDYPSASFGTQNLAPGASFHYKFKVIGEGPLKMSWTDEAQKEHNAEGPSLHEGQGGQLSITLIPGQTLWQTTFTTR